MRLRIIGIQTTAARQRKFTAKIWRVVKVPESERANRQCLWHRRHIAFAVELDVHAAGARYQRSGRPFLPSVRRGDERGRADRVDRRGGGAGLTGGEFLDPLGIPQHA